MRSFLLLAMQLQQACFALSAAFLLLAMQLQQACLILSAAFLLLAMQLRPLRALFIARDAAAADLLNPLRDLLSPAAMLRQIHAHCSAIHKKTVVLCERGSHPIQPRCDVR